MQLDEDKIKRQLELEEEGIEIGIKKYREQTRESDLSDLPPGLALMMRCIKPMSEAIRLFKLPQKGGGRLVDTRKFFHQFDDEELAYITAKRLINAISSVKEPVQRVAISLAGMLNDHLEYKKFKKEQPNYLYKVEENLKTVHQGHRRAVIMRAKRKLGIEDTEWTEVDRLHIGIKLIDLFIESTGLIEKVSTGRGQYYLQATEETTLWVNDHHTKCELLNPLFMPMVVPPKDWETTFGGGYLSNQATLKFKLIKTRHNKVLFDLADHPMPLVYRAINGLQRTPWRINRFILEVLKQAWETGNGLGNLPDKYEEPLPETPWKADAEFELLRQSSPEVVKAWKLEAKKVYDRRIREASKRLNVNQKIWLAEKFKDEAEIFFVWTLDWRGRLYPVQSFINPQADDSGKALIEFAAGKPLGKRGAFWLAIQLANKFGYDKASFEEREQWVLDHEAFILDSVANPLDGQRFWCEADDPFQFLAACHEWTGYRREGESFASHLPIALDGTCNGLQNFSALLLDEVGGKAVNLVPQEKPQDIYAEVAKVLNRTVEADAAAGDENARIWLGKIDRGITKRGVMTTPYGAKLYGLKDQLMMELEKRDTQAAKYLEVEDNFAPSRYLGKRLYEAIGEVVIAARKAMDWLQEAARVASKAKVPIRWTTPAGFQPHQEYIKQRLKRIDTYWGGVYIRLGLNIDTGEIDKVKQASGVSPNFIHSLDASHLMLTVNLCLDEGISNFSMIHDSYGTHACDTDRLAYLLREAFIKQYSDYDVLQRFRDELTAQLPLDIAKELPPLPVKGKLNLEEVRQSRYFFA